MSAEIEAIGSKYTEVQEKLEEVAGREARLAESLRRAEEAHAAENEALRVQHAEALKLKGVEVDGLIYRLKAEHEEICFQRLITATADLERVQREHTEAFGKLKAEHEIELKRRSKETEEPLAKEKKIHEETLATALASHVSAISLKENRYATAQKHTEEAEQALRAAKLEHSAALGSLATDHTATLRAKDIELTETIAKTEEQYYNALTKLRQDHSETIKRETKDSSIAFEQLKEEYVSQVRVAEISKEGSLTESQTAQEKCYPRVAGSSLRGNFPEGSQLCTGF